MVMSIRYPEMVVNKLGEKWYFTETNYKPYNISINESYYSLISDKLV